MNDELEKLKGDVKLPLRVIIKRTLKYISSEKGGFILAHWDGTPETEELIKNETKATIRCIPLGWDETPGTCMVTGKPSARRVLFARAY